MPQYASYSGVCMTAAIGTLFSGAFSQLQQWVELPQQTSKFPSPKISLIFFGFPLIRFHFSLFPLIQNFTLKSETLTFSQSETFTLSKLSLSLNPKLSLCPNSQSEIESQILKLSILTNNRFCFACSTTNYHLHPRARSHHPERQNHPPPASSSPSTCFVPRTSFQFVSFLFFIFYFILVD